MDDTDHETTEQKIELPEIPQLTPDDFCRAVYTSDMKDKHDMLQWARIFFGDDTPLFGRFVSECAGEIMDLIGNGRANRATEAAQELMICNFNDSQDAALVLDVWTNTLYRLGYSVEYRAISPSRMTRLLQRARWNPSWLGL